MPPSPKGSEAEVSGGEEGTITTGGRGRWRGLGLGLAVMVLESLLLPVGLPYLHTALTALNALGHSGNQAAIRS